MNQAMKGIAAAVLGVALAAPVWAQSANRNSTQAPPPGMTPGASAGQSGPATLERPSGANTRDSAASSAGAQSPDADSDRSSARKSKGSAKRSASRNKSKRNAAAGASSRTSESRASTTSASGASSSGATGCDKLSGHNREDCMERLRSGDSAKVDTSSSRSSRTNPR